MTFLARGLPVPLVVALFWAVQSASAECVRVPPSVAIRPHELVFSGKVVDIARTADLAYRATFEVDQVWAGSVTKHFDLYVREGADGPQYVKGQEYVAFATRLTSREERQVVGLGEMGTLAFRAIACSDVYSISDFIRELDPGKPPKPDDPDQYPKGMRPHVIAALPTAIVLSSERAQTLGSELAKRALPGPADAADLNREITSYSVLDDEGAFVIAYYRVEPDGLLHDLHVRAFAKQVGAWTHGVARSIGSVLRITRRAGFLYVSGHSSPSAAPTLVLDQHLKIRNELDGWLELVLSDGRMVFQRSMTHFQPAHAALLAIYDPRTGIERTFYPAVHAENDRGLEWVSKDRDVAVDRTFSEFGSVPPGRIHFNVMTQAIQVMQYDSRPVELPRRLQVVCDVAVAVPTCVEQPQPRER